MKGPQINGKYTIMAEINMIPFIDVALVLLIIFMVITPVLMKSEILIKLPVVQKADTAPANDAPWAATASCPTPWIPRSPARWATPRPSPC